jgi:predicted transcriptional regulator of viral defense system
MNQVEALRRLERLGVEAFSTRDVGAVLGVTSANAHMILKRLSGSDFVVHLARGRWAIARLLQRIMLPEHLAAPYPAYVSLHSALSFHGLVGQIPPVLYGATVGRTRRTSTPAGTVSLHHMPAKLFTGFELSAEGAKIATPEKALFDVLYLAPGRSRLFSSLPEIDFPRDFAWPTLDRYTKAVGSQARRAFISKQLAILKAQRAHPRRGAKGRSS